MAERLAAVRPTEVIRRTALVGPHRDDIRLRLAGRDVAAFGSAGQQRTVVLAMKLAEYRIFSAVGDEPPLLLLDDVVSELDAHRQRALLSELSVAAQAFVTATSPPPGLSASATYCVRAAELRRIA
jgi:DNA replication and repair protein RecF